MPRRYLHGSVGSNPTPARELGSFDPSLLFPTPLAIFGEVFYIRTAEVGDSGLTPVMKFKFTQQSLPNHRGRQLLLNIQHDIKIEEPFRTFMRITLQNTNYSNNQTEKGGVCGGHLQPVSVNAFSHQSHDRTLLSKIALTHRR